MGDQISDSNADTISVTSGPVALFGSGEYLEVMLEIERALLKGRPKRYVQIPTAAMHEGPQTVKHWIDLGAAQADRLEVESVALPIASTYDANDLENVKKLRGAGLVYLSGGRPSALMEVLQGSLVFDAIIEAWQGGAALAGCSAGAMALCGWIPGIGRIRSHSMAGFDVIPGIGVLPHFDRIAGRIPDILREFAVPHPDDISLIGIDEETALIFNGSTWRVEGTGSIWLLNEHPKLGFAAGHCFEDGVIPKPQVPSSSSNASTELE